MSKKLDVAKMKSSLKLLKKSIKNSQKSNSAKDISEEIVYNTRRGPIVPEKMKLDKVNISKFKMDSPKFTKGRNKLKQNSDKGINILINPSNLIQNPELQSDSPNISKSRRLYKSDKFRRKINSK